MAVMQKRKIIGGSYLISPSVDTMGSHLDTEIQNYKIINSQAIVLGHTCTSKALILLNKYMYI